MKAVQRPLRSTPGFAQAGNIAGHGEQPGHRDMQRQPVPLRRDSTQEGPVEALVVGAHHESPTDDPFGLGGLPEAQERFRTVESRFDDQALHEGLRPVQHGPIRAARTFEKWTSDELHRFDEADRVGPADEGFESLDVCRD